MDNHALNYPPELPVCEHRAEILAALKKSPVVIVCGDTGSGKTTQLPKMALETHAHRIAITQPRRLATVTMAERVADELECAVGGLVGYRHRFDRKTSSETKIEFMTDGVLLAETRFDPLLRAYDTIIVDEAHERSLNVDFLLGILKRILARRRDLKVVVSSATLDADRFAAFFDGAPVISVPGRLFPIEIGYRPTPDGEERDLPREVADAVNELPTRDDILVFLPGERDIRETADYLSDVRGGLDDIIPLLASLPASEQRRAFRSSPRRRIILATNVAETSVTIPGIRAVIDSGLARISRYVHRTQVQRLQIEPISQASAKQRAGRCGRLGPGTCLRLYSEEDFNTRDAYTAPEVLRSSLAGVILTMLDLHLGNIEEFPFIDPPKPAMIREGLKELLELGAIKRGGGNQESGIRGVVELTGIGKKLAKIPVEPRLARMLIAGSDNAVLPSVIPLVAAMSCDDPRRRPIDEKEKADQQHAKFREPGSDFLGTLKLWHWWENETKDLSQSKARKLCKTTYLSYPKMREWRDLARQLASLCERTGIRDQESGIRPRTPTSPPDCTCRFCRGCSDASANTTRKNATTAAPTASASRFIRARFWQKRPRRTSTAPGSWRASLSTPRVSSRATPQSSTSVGSNRSPVRSASTAIIRPSGTSGPDSCGRPNRSRFTDSSSCPPGAATTAASIRRSHAKCSSAADSSTATSRGRRQRCARTCSC